MPENTKPYRILLTCFEPFGGDDCNPSEEAVRRVPERIACADRDVEVLRRTLPTAFLRAREEVRALIETLAPDAVLSVGLARGRRGVTFERVAVNLMDASIPDNDGSQPDEVPLEPMGPAAYFATLPVKRLAQALKAADFDASVSNSAGTFVCNAVMYTALDCISKSGAHAVSGFVHVPAVPEMLRPGEATPSMPLSEIVAALTEALRLLPELSGN